RGCAFPGARAGWPIAAGPPPLGNRSSAGYKQGGVNGIRPGSQPGRAAVARRWNGPVAPPARWNAIATALLDAKRGSSAQRLARDVKLYFALNGALHDAAVATWGAKRRYQSVRPISMIRALAFQGQSSNPHESSFSPD